MWPFLVAAGMSALGSALKYASAGAQGDAAKSTADRNAQLTQDAATDAIHRAQLSEMRAQAKGDAVIAEQREETSHSGVDVNTGSSADIAAQTQQWTELDKEIIRNDALREAYGLRTKEQMQRQYGAYEQQAARNEQLGALIGGIGKVAGIVGPRMVDNA